MTDKDKKSSREFESMDFDGACDLCDDSELTVDPTTAEMLAVAEGWHRGPTVEAVEDPTKLGPIVTELVKQARIISAQLFYGAFGCRR